MTKNRTSQLIQEYVDLAVFHGSANSLGSVEVETLNKAAKRMLKIAEKVSGLSGTQEFSKLLEHPNFSVRSWAAFNLIERMDSDQTVIDRALAVIRKVAKSETVTAIGAELWLQNYEQQKGR
jgi:hypothetical protein